VSVVIGVTAAWSCETKIDEVTEGSYYVEKPYVEAIALSGGIPLMIPPVFEEDQLEASIRQILEKVDGLLLTGGGGGNRFSRENLPNLADQQPTRYTFERKLIEAAWKTKMPLVGICRGYQMIVETFGGSLSSEVIDGHKQQLGEIETVHPVQVERDSVFYSLFGLDSWNVNSFHIQKVTQVAGPFRINMMSPDGVIEGIEALDHPFCFGFQFHPECLIEHDETARRFFSLFVEESKKRARLIK
jgi:putative glutamine amidotransferase